MKAVLAKAGASDSPANSCCCWPKSAACSRSPTSSAPSSNWSRAIAAKSQATVTSARALNDGEIAELKRMLKAKLGREPRLTAKSIPPCSAVSS